MRRVTFILLCLTWILPLAGGCTDEPAEIVEAGLGEEFTLPIGEEAAITREDLSIVFEEVIEDSRCPRNVKCVWAGQATYAIKFTRGDTTERAVLTEPGADGRGQVTVFDYEVMASLEPYPEDPDDIAPGDYKLRMTVSKIPASTLDIEDQAEIYATVIRQVYSKDHTFGANPPDFPSLYLVYTTSRMPGEHTGDAPTRIFPESLRTAISDRLSDLPAEIYWVSSFGDVPLEENSGVKGGGAVISVGNINEVMDGIVHLAGIIYIANLAGGGRTYILEKRDGTWQITGDTGVIWMS